MSLWKFYSLAINDSTASNHSVILKGSNF